VGDSLNFWGDAAVHDYVSDTPLDESAASSFELSDFASLTLFAQLVSEVASDLASMDDAPTLFVVGNLGETGASDLASWDDETSNFVFIQLEASGASSLNSFLDSIALFYPQNLQKYGESSFTLSDSLVAQLAVQLTQILGDTIEAEDAVSILSGYRILSGSDLSNWLDATSYIDPVLRSVAGSISNWDEVVALAANWAIQFSDRMVLDDRLKLAYLLTRLVASQLSLSDATSQIKSKLTDFSDVLDISDAATVGLATWEPFSVADSMLMTDAFSLYISTAEDDYYRRQINDRNIMMGEQMKFFSETMRMGDRVEVVNA
jgi:hypothetical protein